MANDLLLRTVRPMGGAPVNILIQGGVIREISEGFVCEGVAIEEGAGAIALPGLVEGHNHLDKTLLGMGWKPHRSGPSLEDRISGERDLREAYGLNPRQQSERLLRQSVAYGTTHMRSHVDVDTQIGLRHVDGVLETREACRDLVDLQLVAFPQSGLMVRKGTLELLDHALAMGCDVVGGLDPCSMDRDPKGYLDAVFGLAERHGKPVDIHLHEAGEMGAFSIELIIERTLALGMQGRVVISHAFCLGMSDRARVAGLVAQLAEANIHIATAAIVSRPNPDARALSDAGVTLFCGNDGVRDTWTPFGNGDMLERAKML
ncbi:MAG: amidohydrolase, partial [Pseudomonadota bacterium]